MSQAAVAGQLGRSVQWLSNIERGVRRADRYSVLVPIADVIGVSVAELTRNTEVEPTRPEAGHEAAWAVRLALAGHGFLGGGSGVPADADCLRGWVGCAWMLVHQARYGELGDLVPALVEECERCAWAAGADDQRRGFRLLAELYQAVAAMMAKLGESDAAWVAADRSAVAAARAGDAVLAAAAGFRLGHAFMSAGKLDQADRAVEMAVLALAPATRPVDPDALALWGALHLVRAVVAARRSDRATATAALKFAGDAAALVGPGYQDCRFDTEFGPQNVAIHAVSVAVELGDPAEALRRAIEVDCARLSPERRARLLVDVARARAQRRQRDAAVQALEEAERLAPELVHTHALTRETVRELLRRERGRARRGRLDMAGRMGLV